MKPFLWTMGDGNGIGPEIILKALSTGHFRPMIIGSAALFPPHLETLSEPHFKSLRLLEFDQPEEALSRVNQNDGTALEAIIFNPLSAQERHSLSPQLGHCNAAMGNASMRFVEAAASLCMKGFSPGMVTAPIHKEAIQRGGWKYNGHTDFLSEVAGSPAEMLMWDQDSGLRVALATVHCPLSEVSTQLASGALTRCLRSVISFLLQYDHHRPLKLGILGLNPHASDNGVIGNDEITYLKASLMRFQHDYPGVTIDGFFPSDAYFGSKRYRDYDVTIALYHDAGLIPFKIIAFETGVNVSIGLPFIRTSPDHGTAFDIAGKNTASAVSFIQAATLAEALSERHNGDT